MKHLFILLLCLTTQASYAGSPIIWGPGCAYDLISGGCVATSTSSSVWGTITGTLSSQTDLQSSLDSKMPYNESKILNPNGNSGGFNYSIQQPQLKPLQNSPNESWNMWQRIVNIDPDSTGYSIGTNGSLGNIFNIGYTHQGTSSIGNTQLINSSSSFGNGTDPFNIRGYQLFIGGGLINNGVTVTDSIQGYGFQLNIASGAVMGPSSYISGFYDTMNINTQVRSYQSFNSSPHIADVANNSNAVGMSINPTIDKLTGNSTYIGIGMGGTYGASGIGTGGIAGININPTITNLNASSYYNGIYSSTANISGSSTSKFAGYFDGDVNITGSLTFGGALSIGELSAYASDNTVNSGGSAPTIYHELVSQITSPNGVTTANFDYLGVSTASIYTAEANSTATSGPLGIGATSLGLPMVVKTETGSNTDNVTGALFAISLDATSTGGTINQANGGRAVMVPNGITTTNRSVGWLAEAPFGTIATDNWGIYTKDFEKNYFEGALKIGGTDIPTAGKKLHVTGNTKLEGTVQIGATGNAITNIFVASATLDFPNVTSNSYQDLTLTVTGAIDGDVCSVGVKNSEVFSGSIYTCWVSAADTVTIRASNPDAGAHNPASAIYKVMVTTF